MKLILILSCLMLSFATVAKEETRPFGQIISNKEGDSLIFSCNQITESGECLDGNFSLQIKGYKTDKVEVLNAKLFTLTDADELARKIKSRNKKARGKFLAYTRDEVAGRKDDCHSAFATVNLLKEKSHDTSDKMNKALRFFPTFVIEDVLHFTAIPVVESLIYVGKTTNFLIKTARQKSLLSKLLNPEKSGEIKTISNGRFRRIVRAIKEIHATQDEVVVTEPVVKKECN